ncbi:MAG: DegV family protein [Anaerolineaceae bacterium]|nr:DegV family protein [Anaerolineaceae bacterium]
MVKIIADTLSSISVEEANQLGLAYLPQIVIFGEESYRDDSEIDSETFIERLKTSTILPKTTAPYPHLYQPILEELTKTKDEILIICPSSKVSGTFGRATVAAQDFPQAKITILDTPIIGAGLGSVVRLAVKRATEGENASEITEKVMNMAARNRTYFLVDTLEFLQKGGRIGAAKALLGSVLQVKPILGIVDGEVKSIESERTRKKALARFIELVITECPKNDTAYLNVQHGGSLQEAISLRNVLSEKTGIREIPITNLPPAILVHGGPGLLGVSFFVEN